MSAFYDLASLVVVPSGYKASKVYAQKPLTTDGQLTFSRASTATRVNSAGLIETVSSNVPRLDYLNSSCPRLLLEPQRTNLNPYSEQFNNADWEKTYSTITANATTSPDGYTNADAWFETSDNNWHRLYDNGISVTSGTAYTCSLFVKPNGRDWVSIEFFAGGGGFNGSRVWFNIANGTIGTTQTGITAKIENYGNGWYRISATQTAAASTTGYILYLLATGDGVVTYAGDPTKGAYVYGGMTEAGAYATSYIPTTTAAVTRLMDQCEKTATFSNVKHNDCTLFYDFDHLGNLAAGANQFVAVFAAGSYLNIAQWNDNGFYVDTEINGSYFFTTAVNATIGRKKVAIKIDGTSWKIFFNGAQVHSSTVTQQSTAAMSNINLGGRFGLNSAYRGINQVMAFPALTDAQCLELTTL